MGNFSNNAITDVGKMLLADVQAGAVFTPTRIVMGSSSMPSGATTQSMTDVVTPVKSLAINKKKRTPDGKCIFGGVYTNEEVTAPFYFRELALYAKAVYLNEDGTVKSEGPETLYSYGNAGATADYMPAYSTSTVVEKQIDLVTWVGNDAQVDLTIESGIYLTQKQAVLNVQYIRPDTVGFDSLLEYMVSIYPENIVVTGHISGFSDMPEDVTILHGMINVVGGQLTVSGSSRTAFYFRGTNSLTQWTSDWQSTAPAGFGLGGLSRFLSSADDLNNITQNGWYSWHEDTPANVPAAWGNMLVTSQQGHYSQTVYLFAHPGCVLQRTGVGTNWSEWEWINSPMLPGTEYRTTERRNGIAVYKMLGTDGVLKYHLEGETSWKTHAKEIGAAPDGYGVGGPYYHIPPNSAITIKFDNDRNVALIAVQGSMYSTRGVFAVNSFGIGGDTTYVERISGREGILYGITPQSSGNGVVIFNDTADAVVRASILILQGVYPTVSVGNSGVDPVPFEWSNPLMQIGEEYRTTERYRGGAVYKMVDAAGNILWRVEYENSWHLLSSASYVSPATVG